MDLQGKVFVVTGGATGVGAATALLLAGRGASVVVNYSRSEAEARETVQACEAAGGLAMAVQGDVADDAACRAIARAALDRWQRIDGLVNNAGATRFTPHKDLEGIDAADFAQILGVNVVGAFQMTRACAPSLKAARGSIVNISSLAGLDGGGSSIPYAASKGALNTMTLSLARALAPTIRVNAVCPGFIESRWLRRGYGDEGYEKFRNAYRAGAALGETLTPEDVADVVASLLFSPKVTGHVMRLDCGRSLGAPGNY